jgi:hypothetical protein
LTSVCRLFANVCRLSDNFKFRQKFNINNLEIGGGGSLDLRNNQKNLSIMKHLKTLLKAVCFVVCLSISNTGKAQICNCPYTIVNNLQCPVILSYEVLDSNCQPLCFSSTTISFSPGTLTLPCCSTTGYDVYVSVYTPFAVALGVNGVSSPGCNSGALNPVQTHVGIAGCNNPSSNITITWLCGSVVIQ